jgi:hypothetical protein
LSLIDKNLNLLTLMLKIDNFKNIGEAWKEKSWVAQLIRQLTIDRVLGSDNSLFSNEVTYL